MELSEKNPFIEGNERHFLKPRISLWDRVFRSKRAREKGWKVWKFVSKEDFSLQSDRLKGRYCDYKWLCIRPDGTIIVKGTSGRGYAWDGCTPKVNLFHVTWGNFDGKLAKFGSGNYKPYTYYASMVHDVMYQYKRCGPYTRKEADLIFYDILRQLHLRESKHPKFLWRHLYFLGVRTFGWIFKGWRYKSKSSVELDQKRWLDHGNVK